MSLTFAESQLNPDTARKTAKAFANIFYAQQNDEGFTLERHNLIRFIKTWGTNFIGGHIPVNAALCSVFLKQLSSVKTHSVEVEEVMREFEKEVNKARVAPRKTLANEFNERYEILKARQKRKQFIQKFDQEKLGGFAAKAPSVVFDEDAALFVEQDEDSHAIAVVEGCSNSKTLLLDRSERKKQILLCYAILNLNKAQEGCALLKTTLDRCAKEDSLLPVEREFICYLWQHFEEIPDDVANQLLEGFGFLYEKPILKACCAVLKTGTIAIDSDLKKVAALPQLSHRIAAIFCDLFYLSGKNKNILCLYEKLRLQ